MDPHTKASLVPPLEAVPLPRTTERPPAGHTTSTAERGSFCLALCTCGWRGPARRSRDLARKDADRHSST
ncbi:MULTISPECIES: hypothetical protein [unclassified Streptomyces]|uniref:hypothetical protein n=1 Tax=unclassified Streptomyces TaxID=2593676 RepID=UPI00224D43C4|nr:MULTISPECIES: hypothetical protein [unclassified Streptomyces]MCX5146948.1 hypothetical protein [Streptomyces sp. NBC_00320]WSN53956.1 hypothetical protein OG299_21780 [Streptomyces sp. NBC_01296]WSW64274.1 hypothetical protein OG513_18760 [Streptomyces sp. NBC_00998]